MGMHGGSARERAIVYFFVWSLLAGGGLGWVACELPRAVAAETDARPKYLSAEERRQQLLALVREFRREEDVARRVQAVKKAETLGEAAVAALQEAIESELEQMRQVVEAPVAPDTMESRIAELRKTILALRADEQLTKEKIEAVDDQLNELNDLYKKRLIPMQDRARAIHRLKLAAQRYLHFLAELSSDYDLGFRPLPFDVKPYAKELHDMIAAAERFPEAEIGRVLVGNELLAQQHSQIDRETALGIQKTNELRIMLGLNPLELDPKLCAACRMHSSDMATHNFFAHESPLPGKTTPWDRAKLSDTTASGENIFMGSTSSERAVEAWYYSPGHHKNMLHDDHRRIGLGSSNKHWTQMFGN